MPTYDIEVTVKINFEVEADNIAEAEQAGFDWEDYRHFSEVYDITVEEIYPIGDEDE